jgi:hypothetical protein
MSIFDFGGQEYFKYELLSLNSAGYYQHNRFITDYVIDGRITIDFTRNIISGATFNIKDIDDINYLSDLIKPWYCINGYEFPLGHYMLLSPNKLLDGKTVTRYITGYDLLYALEQDKEVTSITFESGENVIEIIESLLDEVGYWVNYQIQPCDEVLPENVSYELGKSKLFIINSLLNMINYNPLWVNGSGVFMGVPWSESPNIVHEFIDNNLSLYESNVNLSVDYSNMYNRVVVVSSQLTQDTAPLYKDWTMEDEGLSSHPFSYTNINRYVTKIVNSEATSQDYVDLRAKKEIREMLQIEESVNYPHAFVSSRLNDGIPYNGDCFRFKNEKLNLDSIYKIEKQQIYLNIGTTVESTIRRVKDVY